MRKGRVIVGIILVVIGLVLAVVPFFESASVNVPQDPLAYNFSPNIIGSGTVTISWSGGSAGTSIEVLPCSGGTCYGQSTPLASGSGSSGTLSFSAQGGSSYALTETNSTSTVTAKVTISGLQPLELIGIAVVVVGAFFAVLGLRRPRSTRAAAPEVAPTETYLAPPPASETVMTGPQAMPSAAPSQPVEETVVEAPPAPSSVPPGGSGRPSRKCGHCGTMNEPWITNCRKCKRPLASTGA
jgi:hypothetical protein